MSSVSSPATSSTSPTSLPSAATTFQPPRIINHETGSATSTVLPLGHSNVGSNPALSSSAQYAVNRRGSVSHFHQERHLRDGQSESACARGDKRRRGASP